MTNNGVGELTAHAAPDNTAAERPPAVPAGTKLSAHQIAVTQRGQQLLAEMSFAVNWVILAAGFFLACAAGTHAVLVTKTRRTRPLGGIPKETKS